MLWVVAEAIMDFFFALLFVLVPEDVSGGGAATCCVGERIVVDVNEQPFIFNF